MQASQGPNAYAMQPDATNLLSMASALAQTQNQNAQVLAGIQQEQAAMIAHEQTELKEFAELEMEFQGRAGKGHGSTGSGASRICQSSFLLPA